MSAHRTPPNRNPLYVSLGVVVCTTCVVMAFGASAQNAAPIFNTSQAAAAAAPSVSPPLPSLIPLPAPSAASGAATAAAAVRTPPGPAAPTPYASTYHPALTAQPVTAAAVAPGSAAASAPASGTNAVKDSHLAAESKPAHSRHADPPRESARPDQPHPRPAPDTHPGPQPGATGDNRSSDVPWWWGFQPHSPSTPAMPGMQGAPTYPRFPVASHTTVAVPQRHAGPGDSGHFGDGYRRTGRR